MQAHAPQEPIAAEPELIDLRRNEIREESSRLRLADVEERTVAARAEQPVAVIALPRRAFKNALGLKPDQRFDAFRVRMVQQQLVVGVLQCKGTDGVLQLDKQYGAFVANQFGEQVEFFGREVEGFISAQSTMRNEVERQIA